MPRKKSSIRRRDNGKFQINWVDAAGKRRYATLDTLGEAQEYLHRVKAEDRDRRLGLRRALPVDKTFEDLVALYEDAK